LISLWRQLTGNRRQEDQTLATVRQHFELSRSLDDALVGDRDGFGGEEMVQARPEKEGVEDEGEAEVRRQSVLGHSRDVALAVESVLEARLHHVPTHQTLAGDQSAEGQHALFHCGGEHAPGPEVYRGDEEDGADGATPHSVPEFHVPYPFEF
jgi:hypothetical protein